MEEKISEEQGRLMIKITKGIWNKRFKTFSLFKDDMQSYAYMQMCSAIKRYDESKNVSLNTYLNAIAWKSMTKYVRDFVYKNKGKVISAEGIYTMNDTLLDCRKEYNKLISHFLKEDINYENIEKQEFIDKFNNIVEERNKHTSRKINIDELHFIINKLYEGYNKCEISKMLCVSSTNVNKKVNRIRDIITEIKNNE